MALIDSHGRTLDYVRLAVTDRCNLRCAYCMPAHGIDFVSRTDLLSYEEMIRLLSILNDLGIHKLRITGGEPLVRRGLVDFLGKINSDNIMDGYHLTTNATLTFEHIDDLLASGLRSVNISLDTLNNQRFREITRRDKLPDVLRSIDRFHDAGIPIKINMVVMKDVNEEDIIPMAELALDRSIEVRFLEEMPFNGTDDTKPGYFTFRDIENILRSHFPGITKLDYKPGATSTDYEVPGWKGRLGIIASYSRTFCGTCNRLRITPTGQLKTCLYGSNVLDLRHLLRSNYSDNDISLAITEAVSTKPKDGFEAEQERIQKISESMASIGG